MNISTIRPGLLVSLKTSLSGNVHYASRDIEPDHIDADGARRAKWETQRTVEDPQEHEAAVKVRSKARSLISAVCAPSSFGLLCPESDASKLTDAIEEAREVVAAFNRTAKVTRVAVYIIAGRVAPDDAEAVRAINGEVRELLTTMETGLQRLDVATVRDAANRARALASMLSPEAAGRTQVAIEAARKAARLIVKAGEAGAVAIDAATLRTIRESRTAFLDLDDAEEVQAPTVTGRALDLGEAPAMQAMPALPQFRFEV